MKIMASVPVRKLTRVRYWNGFKNRFLYRKGQNVQRVAAVLFNWVSWLTKSPNPGLWVKIFPNPLFRMASPPFTQGDFPCLQYTTVPRWGKRWPLWMRECFKEWNKDEPSQHASGFGLYSWLPTSITMQAGKSYFPPRNKLPEKWEVIQFPIPKQRAMSSWVVPSISSLGMSSGLNAHVF